MANRRHLPTTQRLTIRQSIAAIERRLLADLDPRERANEMERLATLQRLLGVKR